MPITMRVYKTTEKYEEALREAGPAVTLYPYLKDPEPFIEMRFDGTQLCMNFIIHEIVHAAFYYVRRFPKHPEIEKACGKLSKEELIAMIAGEIAEDALYKLGRYFKFEFSSK